MNDQPLETAPVKPADRAKKYSKLEAHTIGLGAIAAAVGLEWLLGLNTLDKAAIALYTCAVLIYGAVLSESRSTGL